MAGMGPAPKPANQRQRRNATVAMTRLPMEGRKGRTPKWPLIPDVALTVKHRLAEAKVEKLRYDLNEALDEGRPGGAIERRLDHALEVAAICETQLREQRAMEQQLWRDLWKLPQAVQWERLKWLRDVAQYVRFKTLGELGDLNAAKEARQWSDRLGLTPMAMLRLRWEVAVDETAQRRQARAESQVEKPAKAADPYATLRAV